MLMAPYRATDYSTVKIKQDQIASVRSELKPSNE